MKIVLTGGGTGGHFFPLIAVAESIRDIQSEQKIAEVEIIYMAPEPYNKGILYDNDIRFIKIPAGKRRVYFSILNYLDIFKTIFGFFLALWKMFLLYPDVVFSKGGFASFPVVLAARTLRIPIIVHESDTVPGRANRWAGKRAEKVAVSYPQAQEFFPKEKTALTGQPIRKEIRQPIKEGARQFLRFEEGVPVLLILGGSQGAQIINEAVVDALPKLVEKFYIIHQAGDKNLEETKQNADLVLGENPHKDRYNVFGFLNDQYLKMAAGIADVVISRAGSTIFEIASWELPSIIVPITKTNGDHQRKNAFAYARAGGCHVVEEINLSGNILASEAERMITDKNLRSKLIEGAKSFAHNDAGETIAQALINIGIKHER